MEERDISERELRAADEIWLTSSTRDVFCVRELDGLKVGGGPPYSFAEKAFELLRDSRGLAGSTAKTNAAVQQHQA